jgi:ATP-dependent Clp protease ATP-binding subunit ClpX
MAHRNAYCSFCRKSYRDVGPLVEGPGDVYICGECIDLCQSIIDQEKRRRGMLPTQAAQLPSWQHVQERLGQYVRGQGRAQTVLIDAAHRHYGGESGRHHVLLLGPKGSGKGLLARALAHVLDVPFAMATASPGGGGLDSVLSELLGAATFDVEKAQRGIIYVDALDEVATVGCDSWRQPVLEMLRGTLRSFPARGEAYLHIDTGKILFICGAVFAGLGQVVAARLGVEVGANSDRFLDEVCRDDLLAYGVAVELVDRLSVWADVQPLEEAALVHLLNLAVGQREP